MYYVYIMRCTDGSLYTGITTDLARRFAQHSGTLRNGAKYTALHRPVCIEAAWSAPDRSAASKLEYAIKSSERKEKLQLIDGAPLHAANADCFERVPQEKLPQELQRKRSEF